jgi:hypothetical protein
MHSLAIPPTSPDCRRGAMIGTAMPSSPATKGPAGSGPVSRVLFFLSVAIQAPIGSFPDLATHTRAAS